MPKKQAVFLFTEMTNALYMPLSCGCNMLNFEVYKQILEAGIFIYGFNIFFVIFDLFLLWLRS